MGLDELKDKALGLVHGHKDQVEDGVEKAADFAKDKVSGHDEQIDKAADTVKDKLGDL